MKQRRQRTATISTFLLFAGVAPWFETTATFSGLLPVDDLKFFHVQRVP